MAIPNCRPWIVTDGRKRVEISAPTRLLAKLNAAEAFGLPLPWARGLRAWPARKAGD